MTDCNPRHFATSAFTLIEVLITIVVMGTALLVLLNLQVASIAASDHAVRLTRASLLAGAKMAEALASPCLELGEQSGTVEDEGPEVPLHWRIAVVETEIALPDGDDEPTEIELRHVTVTAGWGSDGEQDQVELASYAACEG
jgi:prepilin-type N-terminal cleavage/methylation domain-containing protein